MKPNTYSWKLKEIIMVGIIGVIFAMVSFATAQGISIPLLLPLAALGFPPNYSFEIFWGIFFMHAVLAGYIIRKPGVGFCASMLAVLIQFLMGNATGPLIFLSGFVTGLGAEAGYALFRYKRWDYLSVFSAITGCTILSFALTWWTLGYHVMGLAFPTIALIFFTRLISGFIFSGLIGKFLADKLAKTGVLRSYPIGENFAVDPEEYLDEHTNEHANKHPNE